METIPLDQKSCRLLTTRSISDVVSFKTTPALTIAQGSEDMMTWKERRRGEGRW
jgi:hypothetical protein